MINISYEDFLVKKKHFKSIPICTKFSEDFFTPIGIFEKLKSFKPTFLLESANDHAENGRYSYIGVISKNLTNKFKNLNEIEKYLENHSSYNDNKLPPFFNGFIGYLSYESVKELHSLKTSKKSDIPNFQVLYSKVVIIIDLKLNEVTIVYNADNCNDYENAIAIINKIKAIIQNKNIISYKKERRKEPISIKSNMTKDEYIFKINKAKEYIIAGDIFQVVLSQKFTLECNLDPFELYKNVRRENPSPYLSYIEFDGMISICSSPELLVKNDGENIETAPIAGTRAVKNDGKDHLRAKELLCNEKELAEHLMLVDLGRNDIGKISKPGSVKVESFCKVKKYSKVMHLVSKVTGKIKKNESLFSPLRATFPAGTVSGSPKIRAMEIIDELEPHNRNLYAGSIFYINSNASFNSCISIRTIMIVNNKITIQSGGGIVYDSNPEDEYLETLNKARALFNAIENTYEGEIKYDFDYR